MPTMSLYGKTVQYLDAGEGPTVLFLHGWGAPVSVYALLTDHLATGFRVIAPDLPGFGGSEEPSEPWCVDDYKRFVLAFLDRMEVRECILICHSYGGRIAIKMLSDPALPVRVTKAVFIDAAGIRPHHGLKYHAKVTAYKIGKRMFRLPLMTRLFPNATERHRSKAGSADYRNATPIMRQTLVRSVNEDLTHLLPSIPVSTLLIWGENDTATPLKDGQKMEHLIPDGGLVTLKGAGHFSFAESWSQCRAVLNSFLPMR